MEAIEIIIGAVELGAVPVGIYFYKNLKSKLDKIHELEKEIQTSFDQIQDLKNTIQLRDLKIEMLENQMKTK